MCALLSDGAAKGGGISPVDDSQGMAVRDNLDYGSHQLSCIPLTAGSSLALNMETQSTADY